mmetsp:Transcript_3392/g.13472  ORF Transcript_3392/g.13472 Transcript_3392/m.13472 type:complete len:456 (-) Transcript_3392:1591-2958(-)
MSFGPCSSSSSSSSSVKSAISSSPSDFLATGGAGVGAGAGWISPSSGFARGLSKDASNFAGSNAPKPPNSPSAAGGSNAEKSALKPGSPSLNLASKAANLGDPADEASDLRGDFGDGLDFGDWDSFAAPEDDDLGDFLTSDPPGENGSSKPPRSMSRSASMRSASSRDLLDVSDLRAEVLGDDVARTAGVRSVDGSGFSAKARGCVAAGTGAGTGAGVLKALPNPALPDLGVVAADDDSLGELKARFRGDRAAMTRAASALAARIRSAALFSAVALTRSPVCECARCPCSAAAALVAARRSASMADALADAAAPLALATAVAKDLSCARFFSTSARASASRFSASSRSTSALASVSRNAWTCLAAADSRGRWNRRRSSAAASFVCSAASDASRMARSFSICVDSVSTLRCSSATFRRSSAASSSTCARMDFLATDASSACAFASSASAFFLASAS